MPPIPSSGRTVACPVPCFTPPKAVGRRDQKCAHPGSCWLRWTAAPTIWKPAKAGWKSAGVPLELTFVPQKRHEWLFDALPHQAIGTVAYPSGRRANCPERQGDSVISATLRSPAAREEDFSETADGK